MGTRPPLHLRGAVLNFEKRSTTNRYAGAATSNTTQRAKTIGVSLPRLACYDGEDAVYLNGRLIVGGKVIRERRE